MSELYSLMDDWLIELPGKALRVSCVEPQRQASKHSTSLERFLPPRLDPATCAIYSLGRN